MIDATGFGDPGRIGDVGLGDECLTTRIGDAVGDRLGAVAVDVHDCHLGAVGGELPADPLAESDAPPVTTATLPASRCSLIAVPPC